VEQRYELIEKNLAALRLLKLPVAKRSGKKTAMEKKRRR
jgi:hypothetical protein